MTVGSMHALVFILLVVIAVIIGNWVYKKLNLG